MLVTDDEPTVRESMAAVLERAGHRVHQAGSVAEAFLALERQHELVVAITDVRLPDGDGYCVVDRIRRRALPVGAIMVTGLTASAEAEYARRVGIYDVPRLHKPVGTPDSCRPCRRLPPSWRPGADLHPA